MILPALVVIGALIAAGLWEWRRRRTPGPAGPWGGAWLCLFIASGMAAGLGAPAAWRPLEDVFATLSPALFLLGALAWAGRPARGLLTAGVAVGVLRGLLGAWGRSDLEAGVGLVVDPALVLGAAVVMASTTRGARWPQRVVVPAFVVLAGLEAASALAALGGDPAPQSLVLLWIAAAPVVAAAHLVALSDRQRHEAEGLRESVATRVDERTGELRCLVARLQQEVTQRRQAEETLRQNEERYRVVSELSSDYAFAVRLDPQQRLIGEWITDAFTRITGYMPEELEADRWLDLLHPDDREPTKARLTAAGDGSLRTAEFRIVTKSGETRWVSITMQTSPRGDDGSVRVVGAGRDVTERRREETRQRELAEHLRETQRLESLGVLAGGIAHDFNNLLAVIRGNARLLTEPTDRETAARRAAAIMAAADHAADLTEQMLIYSGKAAMSPAPLELGHVVRAMENLLQAATGGQGHLELDVRTPHPAVLADATQIRQVVLNLVSNAAEALGSRGGRIAVRVAPRRLDEVELEDAFGAAAARPGEYVALEVEDNGCGMSGEERARMFEPFYSTRFPGRGMGLAAVLGIVTAHGGVITTSSRPGEGSRIRAFFPTSPLGAQRSVERSRSAVAREGPSLGRILVVDDDPLVAEVSQAFLERGGFEAVAVHSGADALARVAAGERFDAVLLDLVMPGMGGEATYLELRRLQPEIPVVLSSGYGESMAAERFGAPGVAGFVRKPCEPEELVGAMRRALDA